MFLPGSPCTCCGGGCQPCQFCAPSCLKVTFSGFSHGTGNCHECDHLDDATFYVKRPPATDVSVVVSASGGTGAGFGLVRVLANGTMQNMARRNDGSYYVTAVPVTNGGQNYTNPTLSFTPSGFIQCRPPEVTVAVSGGVITGIAVTDGGEYWPTNSCGYSSVGDTVCAVCPQNAGAELFVQVQFGGASHAFQLYRRNWYDYGGGPRYSDELILSATRPATENGAPVSCSNTEFRPEHISAQYSCATNGTVTISSGGCEGSSSSACDLPDQIQITLGGRDRAFGYGRQNYGAPPAGDPFDGQCGDHEDVCRFTGGGAAVGPATWSGALIAGGTAILDRQPGCNIVYSGFLPDAPSASGPSGQVANVDCGGELTNGGRPVSVSLGPTDLATSVAISAPTKQQGFAASAEVTSVSGTGAIQSVAVTNGGEGYAREIFTRSQPTVTAAITGGTGSGATLTVTLTQSGTGGQATWSVSSVSVTNGGTGYPASGLVTFNTASGDTAEQSAYATFYSGRVAPTVTASVSGSGSGAVLSASLASATGWDGRTYWYVDGISITNSGTGYAELDQVAVAVTDGQGYGAYAEVSSVDEGGAITNIAVYWGGEYFKSNGVITSVVVEYGGTYYKATPTGTAEVDVPEVTFGSQIGFGATATATVNGTVGSAGFGSITAIQITNGGQGYKTGGVGWKISISGAGGHRDELLSVISSDPSIGGTLDPNEVCPDLIEYVEPTATRTTSNVCPLDLLSRTYNMFDAFGIFPGFFENHCGAVYCITGYYSNRVTIVDYGGDEGGITCELSPA